MNRKISACLLAALLLAAEASPAVQLAGEEQETEVVKNQWKGKRVAFLGDSITDKQHLGTTKCYWEYLAELLGLEAFSYGINGNQMDGLLAQAERLYREQADDVDAIIIFGGTNDYNGGVPLGEWYEEVWRNVPLPDGKVGSRRYRKPAMDAETFRGRINRLMDYLKTHFPTKQIIVLTPLHRGFAQFSAGNVQPEEAYPNRIGIYVDEYVQALKEAGNVWAVPVIDLNSISGLYPMNDAQVGYFHRADTDRLHPNAEGHRRMALALMYQLLAFPASFD
ncbi:SGNH/GDSL hydrolase family protein [uncultured Bacteroides sp.]|uniref:SGNH/GDSL hydrolase family protein n=1 Tax=uncultured Bacteroides sp. TaxID=162156 RepID=UPI00260FF179|nr:SGNH/GDSL hydrolase family protein [uncultured Bacteroides sp.]